MKWWICDDHWESIRDLMQMLENEGQEIDAVFNTPATLMTSLASAEPKMRPQGIFLDIDFGSEGEGLDAANEIRKIDPDIPVIFITAYSDKFAQMILLKYDNPFGYLTKPFNKKMVELYLQKMHDRIQDRGFLTIRFKSKEYHLRLGSIIYLESNRHVTEIITEKGEYKVYEKLGDLQKRLNQDFINCHKSFVINMKYVDCFEGDFVQMTTGQRIPVSRAAKARTREAFYNYLDARLAKM